jgi:hypothetical protein
MKKVFLMATAAFLFTGVAFANEGKGNGKKKKCANSKSCSSDKKSSCGDKSTAGEKKSCCKSKTADKTVKL